MENITFGERSLGKTIGGHQKLVLRGHGFSGRFKALLVRPSLSLVKKCMATDNLTNNNIYKYIKYSTTTIIIILMKIKQMMIMIMIMMMMVTMVIKIITTMVQLLRQLFRVLEHTLLVTLQLHHGSLCSRAWK